MYCHTPRVKAQYRQGGAISYATESCFGIGGDPSNPRLLKQILRIKGRPQKKGMIVIAASLSQLRPFLKPLTAEESQKLMAIWPGPVTFLLPASRKVLPMLRGKHQTLAVRIPAHPETQALCRHVGPIVSTSANRSGHAPAKQYRDALRRFGVRTLVVKGQIGGARRPSTIIDFASGAVLR